MKYKVQFRLKKGDTVHIKGIPHEYLGKDMVGTNTTEAEEVGTTSIQILKVAEKQIAVKAESRDLKKFFETGKGLYVWSDFKDRILAKAKAEAVDISLTSYDLVNGANDETIESLLPKKHLFSESEVCAVVVDLIEKQSKGQKGLLLNNGYANLFYTPAFVVNVDWDDDEWYVNAWGRDADDWLAAYRVFSPATGL